MCEQCVSKMLGILRHTRLHVDAGRLFRMMTRTEANGVSNV
jgi:hypothetical protein